MQYASDVLIPTSSSFQLEPFFVARLPLPPSLNHQYIPVPLHDVRTRTHSTLILAPAARAWKFEALLRLPSVAHVNQGVLDRLREPPRRGVPRPTLGVDITLSLKNPYSRDLDNCLKITLDTVFGYLGLDDALVFDLHPRKVKSDDPHMAVAIRVLVEGGR